ncbi:hypothetical protein BOTBODRAFT_301614 [Botryobasidium botryosum FD-172 SS1]|uniref:Uncharacterized protein n=1 Tax=Botryobasidium botryosum (strain FD-172 SS1) TaxID=930990 RepID=A0A067MU28_BOTB1|nr:hypothetical protein BOTBODRAFT_301614 [Botryobasidium botryosum FD-172 SS1]
MDGERWTGRDECGSLVGDQERWWGQRCDSTALQRVGWVTMVDGDEGRGMPSVTGVCDTMTRRAPRQIKPVSLLPPPRYSQLQLYSTFAATTAAAGHVVRLVSLGHITASCPPDTALAAPPAPWTPDVVYTPRAMADPKPKPGSLKDRIAALNAASASGASNPLPAPAPRAPAKPANWAWKQRQLDAAAASASTSAAAPATASPSAPVESSAGANDDEQPARPAKRPGMSVTDAQESTRGQSLKERMAALQGKGAFGNPLLPPPPKPSADRLHAPDAHAHAHAHHGESQSEEDSDVHTPHEGRSDYGASPAQRYRSLEGGSAEADEEQRDEEAERRAAIAARLARVGGARIGLGPPAYGAPRPPSRDKESRPDVASRDKPVPEPVPESESEAEHDEPLVPSVKAESADSLAAHSSTSAIHAESDGGHSVPTPTSGPASVVVSDYHEEDNGEEYTHHQEYQDYQSYQDYPLEEDHSQSQNSQSQLQAQTQSEPYFPTPSQFPTPTSPSFSQTTSPPQARPRPARGEGHPLPRPLSQAIPHAQMRASTSSAAAASRNKTKGKSQRESGEGEDEEDEDDEWRRESGDTFFSEDIAATSAGAGVRASTDTEFTLVPPPSDYDHYRDFDADSGVGVDIRRSRTPETMPVKALPKRAAPPRKKKLRKLSIGKAKAGAADEGLPVVVVPVAVNVDVDVEEHGRAESFADAEAADFIPPSVAPSVSEASSVMGSTNTSAPTPANESSSNVKNESNPSIVSDVATVDFTESKTAITDVEMDDPGRYAQYSVLPTSPSAAPVPLAPLTGSPKSTIYSQPRTPGSAGTGGRRRASEDGSRSGSGSGIGYLREESPVQEEKEQGDDAEGRKSPPYSPKQRPATPKKPAGMPLRRASTTSARSTSTGVGGMGSPPRSAVPQSPQSPHSQYSGTPATPVTPKKPPTPRRASVPTSSKASLPLAPLSSPSPVSEYESPVPALPPMLAYPPITPPRRAFDRNEDDYAVEEDTMMSPSSTMPAYPSTPQQPISTPTSASGTPGSASVRSMSMPTSPPPPIRKDTRTRRPSALPEPSSGLYTEEPSSFMSSPPPPPPPPPPVSYKSGGSMSVKSPRRSVPPTPTDVNPGSGAGDYAKRTRSMSRSRTPSRRTSGDGGGNRDANNDEQEEGGVFAMPKRATTPSENRSRSASRVGSEPGSPLARTGSVKGGKGRSVSVSASARGEKSASQRSLPPLPPLTPASPGSYGARQGEVLGDNDTGGFLPLFHCDVSSVN